MAISKVAVLVFGLAGLAAGAEDGFRCMPYRDYQSRLEYCSDPLYWSHYSITPETNLTLGKLDHEAFELYAQVRDRIFWNHSDLDIEDRVDVYDCLGYAMRFACHSKIQRCTTTSDGGSKSKDLCKGVCSVFKSRCEYNGRNLLKEAFNGTEYEDSFECEDLPADECSFAMPKRAGGSGVILTLAAALAMALAWR